MAVGTTTLAAAALATRTTRRTAGILTGAAYSAALLASGGFGGPVATSVAALPPGLVAALVALGSAGRRSEVESDRWVRRALHAPGALLVGLASGLATDPAWIPLMAVAAVAASAPAIARLDRRWGGSGLPPVLLAMSAVGLFYTLPDPEEAGILLGVSIPLALMGAPRFRRTYGTAGSWVVAGLFVWTVAAGGYGRPSALVGGMACLGVFLAGPMAEVLRRRQGPPRRRLGITAVHAVTVLVAARVAGLQESGVVALAMAVALIGLATAAVWAIEHSGGPRDARPTGEQSPDQSPLPHRQEPNPHEPGVEGQGHDHDRRADQ